MLWIGITGPIGGGKSAAAAELRQMGFEVLDADAIAHKVLSPGTPGEALVSKTFGSADRATLGRIVFSNPEKLRQLENIIHPLVKQEVSDARKRLQQEGHKALFYDVPLLFEKQMQSQFDAVLVVTAPVDVRSARIKKRMGLSDSEFQKREANQVPAAEKEAKATYVIRNEGTPAQLREDLKKFLAFLKISTSRG